MSRQSQKELIRNLLIDNGEKFKPVFWFIGERYSESLNKWVFISHRGPARLTELFQDGIAERKMVKGKTGANYYEYRLKQISKSVETRKWPWEV
ncbi:MAG: hypothetical protein ACTSQE_07515 [Candidatus Heimdallarchaeaceae archaeon]